MAMPVSTTTYPDVKHKQAEGMLILTAEQFTFQPTTNHGSTPIQLGWSSVVKHQISPATHAKHLLKLNLVDGKALTFRCKTRQDLDRLRTDVTARLKKSKGLNNNNSNSAHVTFEEMDPTAMAVTRSTLLAANQTLREQHHYLVTETQTLTETDFWKTHQSLVEEEYAKISGTTKAGSSSLLMSHLMTAQDNKVTLGVEEMRQIFIMYPAVHKAYEEKVPLELSDEQFWRKYLESEFFHRDRGRLGTAAKNHMGKKKSKHDTKLTVEEQDARAAAVGTDDLFSRYDQKLRERAASSSTAKKSSLPTASKRKWGTELAVGQFDLASTFETERGKLLEGPKDMHPSNVADDSKGSRVVQKYNRHWAMVLHPDEAVAGSDLMSVARKSVKQVIKDDVDAKAKGGLDVEMKRLVHFADSSEEHANHVTGTGQEDAMLQQLDLRNVEAYYLQKKDKHARQESEHDAAKRRQIFAHTQASKFSQFVRSVRGKNMVGRTDCIPKAKFGKNLMMHLTKRMVEDSKTEADRSEVINRLDQEFKQSLNTYFRRSSELLRHFYGLRKLEAEGGRKNEQKLARIVKGLEAVYREMEAVRKALPQSEDGEIMRKMCLPIMDQLDWAFKLHRDTVNGSGGGGGFVTVEDF